MTPANNAKISPDSAIGQRVVLTESKGLQALAQTIGTEFDAAVATLYASKGHVILTGMGKSGHIAHKIAATLASTGTPSFFVHPAEAAHGDMGMLAAGNTVIALSESGESAELEPLLFFANTYNLPVIGITREPESTLGKHSDHILQLPNAEPACPLRLAPTTSTTMMLALGDALAICLLEKRGFTKDDFKKFHPGGKLGKGLLKVADLMHTESAIPLTAPNTTLPNAVIEMSEKRLGCVGIVDEDALQGIITDGDLRRHLDKDLRALSAVDIMTVNPKTVTAGMYALEALQIMHAKNITNLFVVDTDNKPVGVIHIHDCLQAGL